MRTLLASLCVVFAVASLNASEVAAGPSFDCDKASTPTEFAICASNDLSALDRELAATYKAAKVNVEVAKGSEAATKLRDEQRQWNKERSSKCGDDVECLSETYQKRILELGSAAGPSPESEWAFFNESVNKITFHLDKITGLTKECIRFFPADYKVDSLGGIVSEYITIALREKHDDTCGGDPETIPIIAFIFVEKPVNTNKYSFKALNWFCGGVVDLSEFKNISADGCDIEDSEAAAEENIGPSFDCDKASTPTEYAICASDDLSALDRVLADAYKVAKGLDNSTTLRDEQRQWNKERSSTCGDDVECLSRMYQERIKVLSVAVPLGSTGVSWSDDFGDWKNKNYIISPECFPYEWWSGDNFEEIAEHHSIEYSDDFSKNTGKYFGKEIINFEGIPTPWGDQGEPSTLYIIRDLDTCPIRIDELTYEEGLLTYTHPEPTYEGGTTFYEIKYRKIQDISLVLCEELAPNFDGTCIQSSIFVIGDWSGGSRGTAWRTYIYGLFKTQNNKKYILPLKSWFDYSEEDALEFYNQWKSTQ